MKRAFFVLLALVMAGSILFIPAAWAAENSPEAEVTGGLISGTVNEDGSVLIYKGIPYAAPPVGSNRWRAPQKAENWEGIRDCFEFAPINMQRTPGKDPNAFYSKEWNVDPEIPMAEDGSLQL